MRDPDDVMAREADEQRLVEGVVRDLYRHFGSTCDVAVRLRTLGTVVAVAHGADVGRGPGSEFIEMNVVGPVRRFSSSPAQYRALMMRVAGKVFGGLAADAEAGLLRETLVDA